MKFIAPAMTRAMIAPCRPPNRSPSQTSKAVSTARRIAVRKPFIIGPPFEHPMQCQGEVKLDVRQINLRTKRPKSKGHLDFEEIPVKTPLERATNENRSCFSADRNRRRSQRYSRLRARGRGARISTYPGLRSRLRRQSR